MKALIELISAFFRWLANRNSPEAIGERKKKETEAMRNAVDRAVVSRDEDAVNRHLDNLLRLILVIFLSTMMCSCVTRSRTVYIGADEKVRYLELDNQPGWWVPESVFGRMMNKLAEAKEK